MLSATRNIWFFSSLFLRERQAWLKSFILNPLPLSVTNHRKWKTTNAWKAYARKKIDTCRGEAWMRFIFVGWFAKLNNPSVVLSQIFETCSPRKWTKWYEIYEVRKLSNYTDLLLRFIKRKLQSNIFIFTHS